jgi:hypothetical protein
VASVSDLDTQRDLNFYPATCETPVRLTRPQIDFFNENGYLKNIPTFDEAGARENREYFDGLLAKVAAEGKDSYSINGYHTRLAGIYDLVKNPLILEFVRDLLGPDFICWGTHYFCKLPGDPKIVAWHQDASYWPLTPSKTVTVWLAIDDADEENGCMRVIPGSHKLGHLTYRPSDPSEQNVLNQTVENAEQYGDPVAFEMKAGEISLHSDLLLHGSKPNLSDRRRCGLTMRYASVDVRSYAGWNNSSILCMGHDPSGHWANHPRPAET